MSQEARHYHERVCNQQAALQMLRRNEWITDGSWKTLFPSSRPQPVIEKLRNAHGFTIYGDGSHNKGKREQRRGPYWMPDVEQRPQLVAVTPAMKEAYYETSHWSETRHRRFEVDGWSCVLCGSPDELHCHHVRYELFAEQMHELMTVCESCHCMIHSASKLKFPSGMKATHAAQMGFDVTFADWLMPQKRGMLF